MGCYQRNRKNALCIWNLPLEALSLECLNTLYILYTYHILRAVPVPFYDLSFNINLLRDTSVNRQVPPKSLKTNNTRGTLYLCHMFDLCNFSSLQLSLRDPLRLRFGLRGVSAKLPAKRVSNTQGIFHPVPLLVTPTDNIG